MTALYTGQCLARMRAVLHIGTEKTGTTSLQQYLFANRFRLREMGICYPMAAGGKNHTKLPVHALSDDKTDSLRMLHHVRTPGDLANFRGQLRRDLAAECEAAETLLLSNEHCSSRLLSTDEVARLKDLLDRLSTDIQVVIYLRRQDDFLMSTYSTAVRCGAVERPSLPDPDEARDRYDYRHLLDRWASVFGERAITVRIYDGRRLVGGNIVSDFCHVVGLGLSEEFANPGEANASLGATQIEFLRQLNRHLPLFEDGGLSPHRGNITELMDEIPASGGDLSLPQGDLHAFMGRFAGSNGYVADRFLGVRQSAGDPLFGEKDSAKDTVAESTISMDEAFAIFAELWRLKEAEAKKLRNEINRLRALKASESRLSAPR